MKNRPGVEARIHPKLHVYQQQYRFATHRVLEILEKIASGKEAIDKERMTAIIKRQILNIHNQVRLVYVL